MRGTPWQVVLPRVFHRDDCSQMPATFNPSALQAEFRLHVSELPRVGCYTSRHTRSAATDRNDVAGNNPQG